MIIICVALRGKKANFKSGVLPSLSWAFIIMFLP